MLSQESQAGMRQICVSRNRAQSHAEYLRRVRPPQIEKLHGAIPRRQPKRACHTLSITLLSAVIAGALLSAACDEQYAVALPKYKEPPTCPPCTIVVDTLFELSMGDGGTLTQLNTRYRACSDGSLIGAPLRMRNAILLIAPEGSPRVISLPSHGVRARMTVDKPVACWGADRFAVHWTGPYSALAVVDTSGTIRQELVMRVPERASIWDEKYSPIVHAAIATPELLGLPFHRVSSDGSADLSFGSSDGAYRLDRPSQFDRVFVSDGIGGLWSSFADRLTLDHFDRHGTRIASHRPHYESPADTNASRQILSMDYLPERDILLATSLRAAPLGAAISAHVEVSLSSLEAEFAGATTELEVFSAATGVRLAHAVLDETLTYLIGTGLATAYRVRTGEKHTTQVLRFTVVPDSSVPIKPR